MFEVIVGLATVIAAIFTVLHYAKPKGAKTESNEIHSETIAIRFFQLFEAHGVHRNQIPSLIDHGLTIADIQNEETLMPCLNEELLNYVCELFAVRREWLDGADNKVYLEHDFYKHPEKFAEFIEELKAQEDTCNLYGVLLAAKDSKDWHESALIVLRQVVVLPNEKAVERYYICNNWSYNYFKSKGYLTACVAIAWKKGVHLQARYVTQELIRKYQDGDSLFEYSKSMESALPLKGSLWYPEDMALKPEVYLEAVAEGEKGKILALQLWLALESDGFMDTDLPYQHVRTDFEQALKDLTNGKKVSTLMSVRS